MRSGGLWRALAVAAGTSAPLLCVPVARAQETAPSRFEHLAMQVQVLQERIENMRAMYDDVGTTFTIVAGVVGIIALFAALRELTSQRLLNLSKETMSLVNDAMALANEATKRAAKMAINSATSLRENIDNAARAFLKRGASDREILKSPADETRLENLVSDIKGFETYKLQFDPEERRALDLTAHCLFLLALRDNYGQDYPGAIESWTVGAERKDERDPNSEIGALSLYWAGMANNNQGTYNEALSCFDRARAKLRTKTGPRWFEFSRIELETSYFMSWSSADEVFRIAKRLDELINEIDNRGGENRQRSLDAARITLGNVLLGGHFQHGASAPSADRTQDPGSVRNWRSANVQYWLAAARQQFEAVVAPFHGQRPPFNGPIWAEFGRAQALWAAGERDVAMAGFRAVGPQAQEVYESKYEDRARLLATATGYICACRLRDEADASAKKNIIGGLLGPIAMSSHLYSQFVMRNVSKSEFRKSVDVFFADSFGAARAPV